jgi:Protein of unknown function (DUF935)
MSVLANPLLNGSARRILGADGRPWQPDGFALPHVVSFAGLVNEANRTYSWRWDEAYKQSRENALAMRRDCNLMRLLRERQLPTEQMPWHIEGEDKNDPAQIERAAARERVIRAIPHLQRLKRSCLEAIWYGRSGAQLAWDTRDYSWGSAYTVVGHQHVNGDKVQFGYDGVPRLLIYSPAAAQLEKEGAHIVYTDRATALVLDEPYWRTRFCLHKHDCVDADFFEYFEAGSIHGVGIRHWLYWYDWLKKEITSWLMDYMERTGLGLTIYYYEAGNAASEAAAQSAAKKDGRNTVIVWPVPAEGDRKAGSGIERIETSTAGCEVILRVMEYFDDRMEKFVVGQVGSSDHRGSGGLGGSHAMKFQAETKQYLIKDDCANLGDSLTQDLVAPLGRFNWPDDRTCYRWVFDTEESDSREKVEAGKVIVEVGVPIKADELRAAAGFSKPGPDDEIVQPPAPQSPPGAPGQPPPHPNVQGQEAGQEQGYTEGQEQPLSYARDQERVPAGSPEGGEFTGHGQEDEDEPSDPEADERERRQEEERAQLAEHAAERDVLLATHDQETPEAYATDAHGLEHVPAGSAEGGQFTGHGTEHRQAQGEKGKDGYGLLPSTLLRLGRMIRPAKPKDLEKEHIFLWHGTTAAGASGIKKDESLWEGARGMNATISPGHAAQYPEDTGADFLVLLRAKTADLDVDPNDQVGDTVEEGLFPHQRFQSSCTVGEAVPVAIFDIKHAAAPDRAIDALEKGDLPGALRHGARVVYLRKNKDVPGTHGLESYARADRDEHGGHWITLGGHPEGDSKHAGGFPAYIDKDGTIRKCGGPKSLVGKKVSEVKDHFRELHEPGKKTAEKPPSGIASSNTPDTMTPVDTTPPTQEKPMEMQPWQQTKAQAVPPSGDKGKDYRAELVHWGQIKAALQAGETVPPEVLADYPQEHADYIVRDFRAKNPLPPLPEKIPVQAGRKTVDVSLPPTPTGRKDLGDGKFELRQAQLRGGEFQDYQPGQVLTSYAAGSPPLMVTKSRKPFVKKHDGSVVGYFQQVEARPLTADEATAYQRLVAARRARELANHFDDPDSRWLDLEGAQRQIDEYKAAVRTATGEGA